MSVSYTHLKPDFKSPISSNDLDKAYDEIGDLKSGLDALNVSTNNGIIEYNKYIELKKKR